MNNLFSIFDPVSAFSGANLNWVSMFLFVLFFPVSYWVLKSELGYFSWAVMMVLQKEYKLIMGKGYFPGATVAPMGLFFFIFFNNFLGLFPYIFTASSHMIFTFILSLVAWLGLNFLSGLVQMKFVLAHLVPQGTPMFLAPLMVLIELTSNIIRPITLSVRLAANMVAGHLIICLISSSMASVNSVGLFFLVFIFFSALMALEVAVSLIQSYVMATLYFIYCSDNNTVTMSTGW